MKTCFAAPTSARLALVPLLLWTKLDGRDSLVKPSPPPPSWSPFPSKWAPMKWPTTSRWVWIPSDALSSTWVTTPGPLSEPLTMLPSNSAKRTRSRSTSMSTTHTSAPVPRTSKPSRSPSNKLRTLVSQSTPTRACSPHALRMPWVSHKKKSDQDLMRKHLKGQVSEASASLLNIFWIISHKKAYITIAATCYILRSTAPLT